MAGRIPEEVIDDIRNRADIIAVINDYVPLKRRGSDFWACCPFHKEKTPSFKVSSNYQAYRCFGCGESGNVFQFIMQQENVDFVGAVRLLAQRVGVVIPETSGFDDGVATERRKQKERVLHLLDEAAKWYQHLLTTPAADIARNYLTERGIDNDTAQIFQLGYSLDSWDATMKWAKDKNFDLDTAIAAGLVVDREADDERAPNRQYDRFRGRLMFPIHDDLGRVVGFSARQLTTEDKGAKYINTPETAVYQKKRLLYGMHIARKTFRDAGTALVCEGQLDVIACHRAGLAHAVAPLGTAFTEEQAHLLQRSTDTVTFMFDADSAGRNAAIKSMAVALDNELDPFVVSLPPDRDPDDIFRNDGPDALRSTVEKRDKAMDFALRTAREQFDTDEPEGKDAATRFLIRLVAHHKSPVTRSGYAQWIASSLNVPEHAVFDLLNQELNSQRRQQRQTVAREQRREHHHQHQQQPEFADSANPPPPRPKKQKHRFGKRLRSPELTLLDLAFHNGFIAHQLTENLDPDALPDTPATEALHIVMNCAAEGHHAEAGKKISAQQNLVANPEIARILMDSEFPTLPPEADGHHDRDRVEKTLQRAVDDCRAKLDKSHHERCMKELKEHMNSETDPERLRKLMLEYQTLARQRAAR